MANIANIVVFDGAVTPVAHTLVPTGIRVLPDGASQATWREAIAGLPNEAQVNATLTIRKLKSGVSEVRVRVNVPVMESIAGQNASGYTAAPKVAYIDSDEWVKRVHPRSNITGRRLCKQLLTNMSNNVSTTVAAATTGVFDDAVVANFSPT